MIKAIVDKIRRRRETAPAAPQREPGRVDVKVDHAAKTMTGGVYLTRPQRCPHKLARRDKITGKIEAHEQCTGESGHPSEKHADRLGRIWS